MKPYYEHAGIEIFHGNVLGVLKTLPDNHVQTVVTSPPYWGLRDYGVAGQLGLEPTPEEYTERMVEVFREVRRVLRDDGTCWVNLGDSYAGNCSRVSTGRAGYGEEREGVYERAGDGLKSKDLCGIPWRVAFALQKDGWYLRQDIIWHKPNPMPESVTDRCTKAHEYIFLLTKNAKYFYDAEAIREPIKETSGINMRGPKCGKERVNGTTGQTEKTYDTIKGANKRSVWSITTQPYPDAHFATFPKEIPHNCMSAGSKPGDVVMDIFHGSGTSGAVAMNLNRKYIGIELSEEYIKMSMKRFEQGVLPL